MSIDYKEIGKRIARRRNVLDITQAELAERANLSATYTGNIERGNNKCSIETLMKICFALEITPDYILLGVDNDYRNDALTDIKDLIYRCEPRKRKLITEYAKWIADQDID